MSKGNDIALDAIEGALTVLQVIEISNRFKRLAQDAIRNGKEVVTKEELEASVAANDAADKVLEEAMQRAIAEGR